MTDPRKRAELSDPCLECGGWGRFWTINEHCEYGPLYPMTLPCTDCGGTGIAELTAPQS